MLISGCGNFVPASPNTSSGGTSVCTSWIDAERASCLGICLVQITMNLGQDLISQQMVLLLGMRFA